MHVCRSNCGKIVVVLDLEFQGQTIWNALLVHCFLTAERLNTIFTCMLLSKEHLMIELQLKCSKLFFLTCLQGQSFEFPYFNLSSYGLRTIHFGIHLHADKGMFAVKPATLPLLMIFILSPNFRNCL